MKKGGKRSHETGAIIRHAAIKILRILVLRDVPADIRHGIGVVFLFAFAGLSALSLFGIAGRAGEWIAQSMALLFGSTHYLFPIIVCAIGIAQLSHDQTAERVHPIVYATSVVFFLLSFTAFWHLHVPLDESWRIALAGQECS